MTEKDFGKYKSVDEIVNDIKDIVIQGATNVAIATVYGLILHCSSITFKDWSEFYSNVEEIGKRLAYARKNEPLAQNALRYLIYMLKTKYSDSDTAEKRKESFLKVADEYLNIISDSKLKIIENGIKELGFKSNVFTHCHSSTVVSLISGMNKKEKVRAVCTETRPKFQGRITAKELLNSGVDTTLTTDSAAGSYIIGRTKFPVDVVLLGADEITVHGDMVNKVGSWGIALSAYYANIPVYVVTPFLKINPESVYKPVDIEIRNGDEIWEDPPENLKFFNPAFDFVDHRFVTGYITELGIIKPEDILRVLRENYGWVF